MSTVVPRAAVTLADALNGWADTRPDAIAYRFLGDGDGEVGSLTFGALRRRAMAVAARLSWLGARGDRAILVYPQGLDFIVAFFGCLYAGVVAVPVAIPNRKRGHEVLRRIVADADARWLLSTSEFLEKASSDFAAESSLRALAFIDTEACTAADANPPLPPVGPETLALLQYTSGSTGSPRGVAVTHANLNDNQRQLQACLAFDDRVCIGSWLPLFHDMGLGTALHAAWAGRECVLMSPRGFLQEPRRWLRAISDYRITVSGGPDFAYDLCVRRVGPADRSGLDLSSWRVAYNGSEPVRPSTLDRFSDAFRASGFRRESFCPLFGLAEATLLVASEDFEKPPIIERFSSEALANGRSARAASTVPGVSLVSCGHAWLGTRLAIVNPETRVECEPGQVGEIWVRGASVAAGYWGKPAETEETFRAVTADGAGPFLRTGDLGFLSEGRLFVTGRHKDLIIVRGRNHYPQDIEDSASTSHPALVPHACAAFSVEVDQAEELVIVQEVSRSALRTLDVASIVRAIRGAVSNHHALHTHAVVLLKPTTLPRTTSGKVRRKACREAYVENSLPAVATWLSPVATPPEPEATPSASARSAQADRLIDWLRQHAADLINAHATLAAEKSHAPLLRDLATQGLLGMQVEPAYGGLGLASADTVRVLEQLAAIDFALALFVGRNNSLGIQPIARHARSRTKAVLLPALAQGREFAAFAFEEPSARATPATLSARAEADGEERWQLFGTKYLDGVAERASVINVFARHDEPPGISAFVVSDGAPGLRQVRDGLSTGLLGFARDTVALDGAGVGRENLLASLGSGVEVAREAIMHARLAIAAACIGGMKRCAQLVGGSIIGSLTPNPVVLARLGSVTASITALECLVRGVARAVDAGYSVPSEAFFACKILAPELLLRCVDDLMRLGMDGRSVETVRISRLHRDAGLLRNVDGPPEALAELTGAVVMDDDSSLRRLVEDVLRAPAAPARIAEAIDAVRRRMTTLSGALARRAQRWGHTRAGELAAWVVLLAAVDGSRHAAPTPELDRAHAWAEAQLEHALASVRFGTPSETATLDTSDVAATFAAYARTIGDPEPAPPTGGVLALLDSPADGSPREARSDADADAAGRRDPRLHELRAWTTSWLARHLQIPAAKIETGRSFADHGLDSVSAVALTKALSDKLGRQLDETLLWNFPTIDAVVEHLAGASRRPSAPAPALSTPARPNVTVESELDEEIARLEQELRTRP